MSATIVFRGLLVFHYMNDHMEIGVVNTRPDSGEPGDEHETAHAFGPAHVPRIIKTENGVVSSIFDLRERSTQRDWEIEVEYPLQPTATKFEVGAFVRAHHPYARDYRWITDLESSDLHGRDLTTEVDPGKLAMVVRVRHGEFYTHQLSKKPFERINAQGVPDQRDYGRAAQVTGCKIAFEMGSLTLKAGNRVIYTFDEGDEDNVVYEFSNAPPDVPPDDPYPLNGEGHFPMYYHHFFHQVPQDAFNLIPKGDVSPAPDPALCGAVTLGDRDGGL